MSIQIRDLIPTAEKAYEKTITVEFKSMRFTIRHMTRADQIKFASAATVMRYDDKEKTRKPDLDGNKLVELINKHIIVSWDNVTLRNLNKAMLIEIPNGADLDAPIEMTKENLDTILGAILELDQFLYQSATDASLFNAQLDPAVTKNSSTSQIGA